MFCRCVSCTPNLWCHLFIFFTETVTMFGESVQSQCPTLASCLFSQPLMCVTVSPHMWAAYPRVKAGPLFTSALCYGFLCTWAPTLVRLWPAPCSHSPCCISEPWCTLGHFPWVRAGPVMALHLLCSFVWCMHPTLDQAQVSQYLCSFSLHLSLPTFWETFLSTNSSSQVRLWG